MSRDGAHLPSDIECIACGNPGIIYDITASVNWIPIPERPGETITTEYSHILPMKSNDTSPEETRRITIPPHIAERLTHRLERTTFDSMEEYAVFALECLLDAIEKNEDYPDPESHEPTTPEDVEGVEDRLESLGYL